MDPMVEQDLLTEVIRALVDNPHAVRVYERRANGASHMRIEVDARDRGKVIGKSGTTMRALRVLFGRIAAVEGRKIYLHVEGDDRAA
jgi:predicted RNA-binding protein YlqC (UPF0109 family)